MEVDGRRIAVFNLGSGFAAIDAECPHNGGPLSDGLVADSCVTCPLHNWRIDLGTGEVVSGGEGSVRSYEVIERDGDLLIGLDLPVAFALNPIENLHLGARTSVYVTDFRDPGESVTLPLGLFAGLSFGTDSPFVEIAPFFTWPKFAQPGASDPGSQKLNTDVYTAGLSVRGFIFF